MIDSNGSNTTAAAAVLCAKKHQPLKGADVVVLGGTGPVGQRAAQLLAGEGAAVRIASRSIERAEQTCRAIESAVAKARVTAFETKSKAGLEKAVKGASVIVAAGAAGVQFLSAGDWQGREGLRVAIDVNAVPPAGLEGLEVMDKAKDRQGVVCYGAIGVGGLKMKIHKAAVGKLFETNDLVLDTHAIYEIGAELQASR
jgi:glutamyl-tRNA reductase